MVTGVYTTFTGPFQERHLIRAGLLFGLFGVLGG
jgi:hypothetical protein